MNHDLAVKLQACEKYLLGELSRDLREDYEEHFFSCAECATQVRMAAEMVGAGQRIFLQTPAGKLQPGGTTKNVGGWLRWFRPAIAVPVLAGLLLMVGYQNLITIPTLRQSEAPRLLPMHSLISANTRGETAPSFTTRPNEPIGLYVDLPADPAYSIYEVSLQDPSGKTTLLRLLSYAEAQKTQVVVVNPGKLSGQYALIVSGQSQSQLPANGAELAHMQFSVDFAGRLLQHQPSHEENAP